MKKLQFLSEQSLHLTSAALCKRGIIVVQPGTEAQLKIKVQVNN